MRSRQLVCLTFVFCALWVTKSFAAPAAGERPVWLRFAGNSNPSSLDIFKAFHTPATPSTQEHSFVAPLQDGPAVYPFEFRSMDGSGNNVANPHLGQAETPFLRLTTRAYGDGTGSPAG